MLDTMPSPNRNDAGPKAHRDSLEEVSLDGSGEDSNSSSYVVSEPVKTGHEPTESASTLLNQDQEAGEAVNATVTDDSKSQAKESPSVEKDTSKASEISEEKPPLSPEAPKTTSPSSPVSTSPKAEPETRSPSTSATAEDQISETSHRRNSSNYKNHKKNRNSIALARGSVDGHETKPAKVIIQNALEHIKQSKDAKRIPVLNQTLTKVLDQFREQPDSLPPASLVLEPLKICCAQVSTTDTKVTALDCIGKLFSFNYIYDYEDDEGNGPSMLKEAIDTVCGAYDAEATHEKVEMQIVKALTAALVSEDYAVHGQTLLKAARHIYNVFVVSHSLFNQTAAQVAMTQVVQAVFDRVKAHALNNGSDSILQTSSSTSSAPATPAEPAEINDPLTLEQMRNATGGHQEFEDVEEAVSGTEREEFVGDAYLLFRTLCKLAGKADIDVDVGSQALRSKLFSLHLIHTSLKTHITVFKAPELNVVLKKRRKDKVHKESKKFKTVIKDHLWNTLAVNATSSSPAIFEVSAEIFWLLFSNLRSEFKRQNQIFLTEVYFTIMDMRTSTMHQKLYFMGLIARICTDPRALVELYLNYDCDPTMSNVFENLIALVSRLDSGPLIEPQYYSKPAHVTKTYNLNLPPSVALQHLQTHLSHESRNKSAEEQSQELFTLKICALDALIDTLQSLLLWSHRGAQVASSDEQAADISQQSLTENNNNQESTSANGTGPESISGVDEEAINGPVPDEPTEFARQKSTKRALDTAIADFNYKPERGVARLVELGIVKEKDPQEVAEVLYKAEGIDKVKLGDFLGGSDEFSQQTMHHFIFMMKMEGLKFVEALRMCLQAFRLPGEGQVVDRFMLQFASRFHTENPTVFANAELAYCLAYSAMMLNTELHTSQLRRARMTFEDFVVNNRGLNDGFDFPEDFLREIYEEIKEHEIELISEQQERIIKEESYDAASAVIASKTFDLFRMINPNDDGTGDSYYNASHVEHVRPMFEVSWMSILAGLSGPFQQLGRSTSSSYQYIKRCLDGMALATRIACHFDVDLARVSFVQTLTKFASLGNASLLTQKNTDTVYSLFKVALEEGNTLKDSWYDVLVIASQVDRLQAIAQGVPASEIPDVVSGYDSTSAGDIQPEVTATLRSRELGVICDKVFAATANLNASAIISFINALSKMSLQEIKISRDSPEPRTFSLKKMVEVCYYNMSRIRMEWSQVWLAMAEYFNIMVCDPSKQVAELSLDSLRQLSMRFLDIEELPHFLFQKDFLAPFEYALVNSSDPSIKVLVIECLKLMVTTKSGQLKSGWAAIFSSVGVASESHDPLVLNAAFQLVATVPTKGEGALPDGYLDALCMLAEQQDARIALRTVDLMTKLFDTHSDNLQLWHELFTKFSGIAMRGKDLEVRGRCLTTLFAILTEKGNKFDREDWDAIFKSSLFPLFSVLYSGAAVNNPKEIDKEELSLWLSSTLVQALRSLVALFGSYFDMLEHALDPFFLDLLRTCITQENDPVARMGNTCLQQLVHDNADRFTDEHWHQIAGKIVILFQDTTPAALRGRAALDDPKLGNPEAFRKTIAKVIQTLNVMETVRELLVNTPDVMQLMPVYDILRIIGRLKSTYTFARDFNRDHELRVELYQRGIVRQTPNLLIQESMAAQTYISVSMRLYRNNARFENDTTARAEVAEELMPLCLTILKDYNALQPADHRYVKVLTPIVESILRHISRLDNEDFALHIGLLYLEVIEILNKDMPKELREAVQAILRRVADVHMKL